MKSVYLKGALLLLAVAFFVCAANRNEYELTPIQLENVEALASGEDEEDVYCVGYGNVICPIEGSKVKTVMRFLR